MRITLCAASLTATAALFTTLPTATAAPYGETGEFSPEQQTLLSHIAKGYDESNCKPVDREDGKKYVAVVVCKNDVAGAPTAAVFYLYENETDMKRGFKATFKSFEADATCGGHTNPALWGSKSNTKGQIACVRNSEGTPALFWTNKLTLVTSYAEGTDPDELMQWWNTNH